MDGRRNNLDIVRIVLAVSVLLFHSHLFVRQEGFEPVDWLSGGTVGLGTEAVGGFFAISGILITASWQRRPQVGDFLKRRILRIHPAFLVVVAFCLLIVGPIGAADTGSYFADLDVVRSVTNALLLNKIENPAVFQDASFPRNLNGSLWSIKIEFEFYLLAMVLGLVGLYRRRELIVVLLAGFVMGNWLINIPSLLERAPMTDRLVQLSDQIWLGGYFVAGTVLYLYRHSIPRSRALALAAAVLWVASAVIQRHWLVAPVVTAYLVAYVGYTPVARFRNFAARGDVSYGLYLYGWPVQLLVAHYITDNVDPNIFFLICLPPVFVLAALSWQFIERPSLARVRSGGSTPASEKKSGSLPDSASGAAASPSG